MAQSSHCAYAHAKLGASACVPGAWDSKNERYKMYPSKNVRAAELVPPESACVGTKPIRRHGQTLNVNPCDPCALATPEELVFLNTKIGVFFYKKRRCVFTK